MGETNNGHITLIGPNACRIGLSSGARVSVCTKDKDVPVIQEASAMQLKRARGQEQTYDCPSSEAQ
jgi:hypothetical protein